MKLRSLIFCLLFIGICFYTVASSVNDRCMMCGRDIRENLKTTVITDTGGKEFCCPHCAIMYISVAKENIQDILARDFYKGTEESGNKMHFVVNEKKALCCAPLIAAFSEKSAAEEYRRKEGGSILTWKEIVGKLTATKCEFCGMPVYPPEAVKLTAKKTEIYGCCPLCALALTYQHKADKIRFTCSNDHKHATLRMPASKNCPVVFWQGLKELNGSMVPAGCHFNRVFCRESCFNAWRIQNKEVPGNRLNLNEALLKAKMMYEKKKKT
ncbi:MAG: hypothetical protein ACM3WV_06045 [Bacillota bacterium]